MLLNPDSQVTKGVKSVSLFLTFFIMVSVFAVAAGWFAGIPLLKSITPDWVSMKLNTALSFGLLGAALIIFHYPEGKPRLLLSRLLAISVLLLASATFLQYFLNFNLGIDELLVSESPVSLETYSPGRMAASTAAGLIVSSVAFLFISTGNKYLLLIGQGLSMGIIIFFFIPLLGYLYGVTGLYGYRDFTSIAFHTSALFILLGTAILFSVPGKGIMAFITRETSGGYMLRRLVPLTFLLPVTFVWILIIADRRSWVNVFTEVHIIALFLVILFLILTFLFFLLLNTVDKKRMEAIEEAFVANQHISSHIDNTPLAVVEWDNRFRVRWWSDKAAKLFGWKSEEVMKKVPGEWKFVHEEDQERVNGLMNRMLALNETSNVSSNRNYAKDGKVLHCIWYNSAVFDSSGKLLSILSLVDDVTGEKKTEQKLRQNEFLLRIAGDLAHIGGWRVNLADNRVIWSDQVAFIHDMPAGYSPSIEEGIEFYAPEFRDRINHLFSKCTEEGTPWDEELQIITRLGRRVWVRSIGVAEYDDQGNSFGVIGGFQDISDRKKREEDIRKLNEELEKRVIERTKQLTEINKELEAFSYSVSHDLRAPLRAIDGFAGILIDDYSGHLDDEGKRICDVIQSNTWKMGQLIEGLLAFSRLGRRTMDYTMVDMTALVKSIFSEIVSPRDRKRIVFETDCLCTVKGDKLMLRQLWVNLISNSLKFTANVDNPVIRISCSTEDHLCKYRITDNGAGFNMQYVDKIFEVFRRLHSEGDFEGSGVGLAIVQRVVHRHGGTIKAESSPLKETSFTFTLPVSGTESKER
jgi:PAS domain S-box-containing protein